MESYDAVAEPGSLALRVEGIVFSYDAMEVLKGVTFDAKVGEITALVGQNGAGKSTLLNILSGFRAPQAGAMYGADGLNLRSRYPHQRITSGIARTFQDVRAFPRLSVIQNVLLALNASSGRSLLSYVRGVAVGEARRAMECLEWIGLEQLADQPASVLSFGQQRRLALAQLLASGAELALLDEPTAGLDPGAVVVVEEKLLELNRDQGMTIIIIEHNLPFVRRVAHSVVYLNEGVVEQHSQVDELLDDPAFRKSYLGVNIQ